MKTRRLQMDKQREKERYQGEQQGIIVSKKYRNIKKTEKKKEI